MQSIPPLFVVEMYAFNEALELETNISNWILSGLLPEINNLSDDYDHVLDYISDDALDPFLFFSNTLISSSMENNKENTPSSSPKSLVENVSGAIQNVLLDDSCKEKPRNRLAHLINSKTDTPLTPKDSTIITQANEVYTKSDVDVHVTEKCSKNLSYPDIYSSNGISHYTPESSMIPPLGNTHLPYYD